MATTIGNLAVVLSANAAPFISGLRTAVAATSGAVASIGRTLASVGTSTAVFAGVGGLLSGGGLFAAVQSGLGRLEALDAEARRLGVTVKDLDTLMLAAGPASAAMTAGLGSLALKLAEARAGALDATRSFARLTELSGGGALTGGTLTEQFRQIAERLGKIPAEATRAALAYDLFGDKAGELLPLLSRGAAGIDAAADKMRRFGLGANAGELQAVKELTAAQRDLKAVGTGFLNQITLGIAPVAAEVLKVFDGWKVNLSGLKGVVIDVAHTFGRMGAFVVEAWKDPGLIKDSWGALFAYLKAGVHSLTAEMVGAFGAMLTAIGEQMRDPAFAGLGKLIGEFGASTGNPIIAGMGKLMEGLGDSNLLGGVGGKLTAAAEQMRKNAGGDWEQAGKQFDALAAKVLGTDSVKRVDALFDRVRARVGDVGKAAQQNNPVAFWQQSLAQFQQQMQAIRSPLEAFGEQVRAIGRFQGQGLFAGQGPGALQRSVAQAFGQLQGAVQLPQLLSPSAALANTREAYSAAVQYNRRDQTLTVAEQMRALQQEANRQQAEQIRIGNEVLRELRQGAAVLKVRR